MFQPDVPSLPQDLAKQGVTQETFEKLLSWGWVNALGRSLDWSYWIALPRR